MNLFENSILIDAKYREKLRGVYSEENDDMQLNEQVIPETAIRILVCRKTLYTIWEMPDGSFGTFFYPQSFYGTLNQCIEFLNKC
jgi:hypothetical protein